MVSKQKLDEKKFEERINKFTGELEFIRYAVYDNFRVLKSTDNYIDKYLPFMVQNMISQNMFCVLPKPRRQTIDENGQRIEFD